VANSYASPIKRGHFLFIGLLNVCHLGANLQEQTRFHTIMTFTTSKILDTCHFNVVLEIFFKAQDILKLTMSWSCNMSM